MDAARFVIFPEDVRWRIAGVRDGACSIHEIEASADASPFERAKSAAVALEREGYRGRGVMLALPTDWCLCGTVALDGLPRQHRRQAMMYRFEEKLPIAAEEVVADFILGRNQAFAVCVRSAAVAPIVEALESCGVLVDHICPAALLAFDQCPDLDSDAFLWEREDSLELLGIKDRCPIYWYRFLASHDDLRLHLAGLSETSRITYLGGTHADSFQEIVGAAAVACHERPFTDAAALAGAEVLLGKSKPPIELRRDGLAAKDRYRHVRRPLVTLVASALILLIGTTGGMLWRAHKYSRLAAQLEERQRAVFSGLFPEMRPPTSVRARLTSEERRVRGLSGASTQTPFSRTALQAAHDVFKRLPRDLRYRVLELRLEPDKIFLDGQARSHGDVDAIAAALGKEGLLSLDAPRTTQLADKGVTFTLNGSYAVARGAPDTREAP